jgi:mannose-6-phosphate isomerase-like protein (cupin superfamily)
MVSPEIPCFVKERVMNDFPEFMRNPSNRIASQSQYTPGIEGYVFDGIDGSQIAIWSNRNGGISAEHTHEYDEYFIVVQGQYDVIIGGKRIPVRVGVKNISSPRVRCMVG